MENLPPGKMLDQHDVVDFILTRFAKGAKCFDGEWWGGSHIPVSGSEHGFDVQVVFEGARDGTYNAVAYAYKNKECDVDIDNILVNKFPLTFWIEVFREDDSAWGFKVKIQDGSILSSGDGIQSELAAHQEAVKMFRESGWAQCPLLSGMIS